MASITPFSSLTRTPPSFAKNYETEETKRAREVADAGGKVPYLIGEIESKGWDVKALYTQMARDPYLNRLWRNLEEYERNAIYVHFLTSKQ